jgi:DNA replication and repair protein RecF
MRVRSVTLQNYRNVPLAQLALEGRRIFLEGANGQGKTNFIEAIGLVTALRSFRSADAGVLVAHGQPEAGIALQLEHETQGDTSVRIHLRGEGKEVWVDQERMLRLADFLGRFPTVIFSSQDQQLIRGAPGARRRWLDLTLSAVDPLYLQALQTYHRGLAERNALLKQGDARSELSAFERTMAPAAETLLRLRRTGLEALAAQLTESYALIADHAEPVAFTYQPDWEEGGAEQFLAKLASCRERDLRLRSTGCGPHRDDFEFSLQGRPAREFASEGQQRLLVIALRLAQSAWFLAKTGVRPVLLADDVVGELDPLRRARFWAALHPEAQVIATGTERPSDAGPDWQLIRVHGGTFTSANASPSTHVP